MAYLELGSMKEPPPKAEPWYWSPYLPDGCAEKKLRLLVEAVGLPHGFSSYSELAIEHKRAIEIARVGHNWKMFVESRRLPDEDAGF